MHVPGLKSCYDQIGGIVYFPRMLAKIRLHAEGNLPADYQNNLGRGFDLRCVQFLGIAYEDLKAQVLAGNSDEDLLQWCFERGGARTEEQIEIWNAFLMKRGWRDATAEIVRKRKIEHGFEDRDDIVTMFDFIEVDEGRPPFTARA